MKIVVKSASLAKFALKKLVTTGALQQKQPSLEVDHQRDQPIDLAFKIDNAIVLTRAVFIWVLK